jgi:hypothetical protein
MAITANRELSRYIDQELRSFLVAATAHIYKGALVGLDRTTGYVRNLVAGDLFAGVAYEEIDNSAGSSGGELSIRLYTQGDFALPANSATQAVLGTPVFALDNQSTTVLAQLGGSYCGILVAVTGTNQGIVRIQPLATPQVELTAHAVLTSSTSAATTNPVLITQRAIRINSVQASFNTLPNSGNLDLGTGSSTPNEIVAAFNLASLTANTPSNLTLAARDVAKNLRIWARVGQASSSAGVGGLLTVRYFELQ